MTTNFERVREFHNTYKCVINESPTIPDIDTIEVRFRLIEEELDEVVEAIIEEDFEAIAKELADLLYVVYGTGHNFGIDLDAAFAEVHRSNMTKLDENGQPIFREDGKVLKGPNYEEADMSKVITCDQ